MLAAPRFLRRLAQAVAELAHVVAANEGTVPDMDVELDPLGVNRGQDSQLDAGIAEEMGIPMSMLPEIRSNSEEYGRGRKAGFLDDRFLQSVQRGRRGVGVFLPTRAGVEETAASVAQRYPRINAAYYHGGEPIRVFEAYSDGDEARWIVEEIRAIRCPLLAMQGVDYPRPVVDHAEARERTLARYAVVKSRQTL